MELSYWESRWNKDNTGFHMPEGYPGLKKYWSELNLPPNPNVLVPLCGKSLDMIFLRNEGANVTGVEVSVKAIKSFFKENELDFETESFAGFTIYQAEGIAIWQGDFLKFPESKFNFDLIYDKAALVALPPEKRRSYAEKLLNLSTPETKLLLHHFIYPQDEMNGPPFSVGESEIEEYFGVHFTSDLLEENIIPPEHFTPFYRRGLRSAITERFLLFNPR